MHIHRQTVICTEIRLFGLSKAGSKRGCIGVDIRGRLPTKRHEGLLGTLRYWGTGPRMQELASILCRVLFCKTESI